MPSTICLDTLINISKDYFYLLISATFKYYFSLRRRSMVKGVRVRAVLLALALLACFFLIYKIHVSYPYSFVDPETATLVNATQYPFPFHNDEWAHLALGLAIAEEHRANFNPYLEEAAQDREIGFHVLLAGIFLLPRINPVLDYQFLAQIMLVINALFLFFLVSRLTKNYWIGLFSIFFFASIRSNTNLLGNWFFVPVTFTLWLIFLFFYFFTKSIGGEDSNLGSNSIKSSKGSRKAKRARNKAEKNGLLRVVNAMSLKSKVFLVLTGLVFLIAIIIYPLAAALIGLIAQVYILTRLDFIKKNLKSMIAFGIIGAIISLAFVRFYFWTGSWTGTLVKFISELVFRKGWTTIEHTYSLLGFYGLIPLALAALGAVYLLLRKHNLLLIIWPTFLLLNSILFMLFKFSLLLPYQRNFFHLMVSLAPLSAAGLYWLCDILITFSKRYVFRKKSYSTAVAVILVLVVLFFTFRSYYKIEPKEFSLQRTITEPEYQALLWLKDNYAPYNVVLAKPFLSIAVYPVSRNRVMGLIPSSMEGGAYGRIYDFFNGNCEIKERVAAQGNVTFVISTEEIDCGFLGKIYYKDGVTVYKVL